MKVTNPHFLIAQCAPILATGHLIKVTTCPISGVHCPKGQWTHHSARSVSIGRAVASAINSASNALAEGSARQGNLPALLDLLIFNKPFQSNGKPLVAQPD